MQEDTIVAIATPPGRGGVGIIRISGTKAYSIAMLINKNKALIPKKIVFCSLYAESLLDQGVMLFFKAPHSFTGEDVIEIQAHGSPIVLDLLLKACVKAGARIANPGEFSQRAFLNDKIDLAQAEAIADLIHASSETAARMALKSLQGEFSNKVKQLNDKVIYLRLYVEAAIDFPDEEIDFLNDGKVWRLLSEIITDLQTILSQAQQGSLFREGLSLVLAGRPNAGKSTLMNQLAGRDVAIVTEIAGTTRDVMKEHVLLDDIPLHFIDTAGLRASDNPVEKEGIKRAWNELKHADVVLIVLDIHHSDENKSIITEITQTLTPTIPIIKILNKVDTLNDVALENTESMIAISAKTGQGMDVLKDAIKRAIGYQSLEGQFLARRRHLDALEAAHQLLKNGMDQLTDHQAGELLAQDLRSAHDKLAEITGEFSSDDLLGLIFSSFCIGK